MRRKGRDLYSDKMRQKIPNLKYFSMKERGIKNFSLTRKCVIKYI